MVVFKKTFGYALPNFALKILSPVEVFYQGGRATGSERGGNSHELTRTRGRADLLTIRATHTASA